MTSSLIINIPLKIQNNVKLCILSISGKLFLIVTIISNFTSKLTSSLAENFSFSICFEFEAFACKAVILWKLNRTQKIVYNSSQISYRIHMVRQNNVVTKILYTHMFNTCAFYTLSLFSRSYFIHLRVQPQCTMKRKILSPNIRPS